MRATTCPESPAEARPRYGEGRAREIGRALREARLARRLDLAVLAEATFTRPGDLEALERGEFDAIAGRLHLPVFLRAYGDHLRLDGEELARPIAVWAGRPTPAGAQAGGPGEGPHRRRAAVTVVATMTASLLLAAVGGAGYYALTRPAPGTTEAAVASVATAAPPAAGPAPAPDRVVVAPTDPGSAGPSPDVADSVARGPAIPDEPAEAVPPAAVAPAGSAAGSTAPTGAAPFAADPPPQSGGTERADDATPASPAPASAGGVADLAQTAEADRVAASPPTTAGMASPPQAEPGAAAAASAGEPHAADVSGDPRPDTAAVPGGPSVAGDDGHAEVASLAVEVARLADDAAPAATPSAARFAIYFFSVRPSTQVASAWRALSERHPDLAGLELRAARPVEIPGKGTLYRVEAGAFETRAGAQAVCDRLRSQGESCKVVVP